ncbi:hypothetical protein [Streptococcus uberis]|uniref:hypothetical protein n=1 Tax=Streptococcus uberis TaxID=1349 RepID=UPI0018A7D1C7|nr:hypothetical protein [Streptococcus uberis]
MMTYKKLLYSYSQVYFENDRFYHLKDETRPTRYFSNYLDYKHLQGLDSLKEDLLYLKVEQKDYPKGYEEGSYYWTALRRSDRN